MRILQISAPAHYFCEKPSVEQIFDITTVVLPKVFAQSDYNENLRFELIFATASGSSTEGFFRMITQYDENPLNICSSTLFLRETFVRTDF